MQYFLTIISQLALYRGLYMTMEKAAYKKLKRVTLSVKCLLFPKNLAAQGLYNNTYCIWFMDTFLFL